MAVWFAGSTGLMAMPSTPLASRSSTIRFCPAAVPSPSRNSTAISARSASAFSVPFRAMVQKSAALFVTNASVCVDEPFRLQPARTSAAAQVIATAVLKRIRLSSSSRRRRGTTRRLEKVSNTDLPRAPLQELIADDAEEDDATHHGEIE